MVCIRAFIFDDWWYEAHSTARVDWWQVKKHTEKVERCRRDVESTRSNYTLSLNELNAYNAKYMEDMNEVFGRTQEFEARRLAFFKKLLYDYHACVDASQITQ